MSKGETAAEAILRLVKQNEQLVAAADVLKEYGSFDNAVLESKRRLADIQVEELKAKNAFDEFTEAAAKEKESIVAEIAAAKAEAKEIVKVAKEKAADLEEKANVIYSAKVQDAEEYLAKLLSDNESRIKALKGVIEEREAGIAKLDADLTAKTTELADTEKKLEKIKAQIAKLADFQ